MPFVEDDLEAIRQVAEKRAADSFEKAQLRVDTGGLTPYVHVPQDVYERAKLLADAVLPLIAEVDRLQAYGSDGRTTAARRKHRELVRNLQQALRAAEDARTLLAIMDAKLQAKEAGQSAPVAA